MGSALRLCEPRCETNLQAATGSDLGGVRGQACCRRLPGRLREARRHRHQAVPCLLAVTGPRAGTRGQGGVHVRRALAGETLPTADVVAFEDHIVWYLAELVAEMDLIFQIHTGMQGNWDAGLKPAVPLPLIRAHRSVRFDLFHAGYPYARELGVLGKHYPRRVAQCLLDLPDHYRRQPSTAIRMDQPWTAERLLGFGSDVFLPEMVYGHLVMASCLADVLAEKVERDFLSKSAALDLARWMLRDAPVALYRLKRGAVAAQSGLTVPCSEPEACGTNGRVRRWP